MTAQILWRTLNNISLYGLDWMDWKTLLVLQHNTARLDFAKGHEKKPDEYWEHILWSDETKIDQDQDVWRESGPDYYSEWMHSPNSEVQRWECDDMVLHESKRCWGDDIDGTMNAYWYTKILSDKVTPSLQKLGRRGIFSVWKWFKTHCQKNLV